MIPRCPASRIVPRRPAPRTLPAATAPTPRVPGALRAAALTVLSTTLLAPAGLSAQSSPPQVGPEHGTLVVVGGNLQDPDIYARFIELAGGPDAPIVYIPTAGGGDYDSFCSCLDPWRANGARNVTVLHTDDPDVADTEAFVAPLRAARGVFFGGGRQWRLVDVYGGTRTEAAVREVLDRGGVVGGSSAGASIQGSYLVRGDTRTNTTMMGDHTEGFGYLRGVGIDQHVLRRNRHYDLMEVVEAHPDLLGIGIDENTALVVRGDDAEVIGQSYVLIYDNGVRVGDHGGSFYFLAPGDRFDLATREATRPARSFRPVENVRPRPGG